jgi:cytochrome P450
MLIVSLSEMGSGVLPVCPASPLVLSRGRPRPRRRGRLAERCGEDALHGSQNRDLGSSDSPATEGHSRSTARSPRQDHRWIEVQLDPPDHTRNKQFINPYFSPGRMRGLEDEVREVADREIDKFIDKGAGDLADVAWRVPGAILFGELLGFPVEDVQTVLRMTDRSTPPEFYGEETKIAAEQDMYRYCYEKLSARRDQPSSGENVVFDHLLAARVNGEPLPFELEVANAFLLVIAGLETTSNALTNTFVWLAEHPDQRERLVNDPTMIPKAIEEFVGHRGSVHGLSRVATEDTELGGCPIKRSDVVFANFAAANRDAREFTDSDECVIDRAPNRHLAFGGGHHRCVGSNLARMELRVTIEQILARMPDYAIRAGAAAQYRHGVIPGYASIPVTFTPDSRRFVS